MKKINKSSVAIKKVKEYMKTRTTFGVRRWIALLVAVFGIVWSIIVFNKYKELEDISANNTIPLKLEQFLAGKIDSDQTFLHETQQYLYFISCIGLSCISVAWTVDAFFSEKVVQERG